MGNSELEKKIDAAVEMIKRDIVFCQSLYLTGWLKIKTILICINGNIFQGKINSIYKFNCINNI